MLYNTFTKIIRIIIKVKIITVVSKRKVSVNKNGKQSNDVREKNTFRFLANEANTLRVRFAHSIHGQVSG